MPPITTATNANSLTITQAVNKVSPSKFANARSGPGDRIKISSPAGGWGPPEARDSEGVRQDLRDGFVTPSRRSRYTACLNDSSKIEGDRHG